jgi:hypothetical protein
MVSSCKSSTPAGAWSRFLLQLIELGERVVALMRTTQRRGECLNRVVCHERRRSTRLRATVREMKEGPSGSVIRSLIPSHREPLRSKAVVVNVAETPGQ